MRFPFVKALKLDCNADSLCNKHSEQMDWRSLIKIEKISEAGGDPQGTPCCYREIDQLHCMTKHCFLL